jgi:hypothetical protein
MISIIWFIQNIELKVKSIKIIISKRRKNNIKLIFRIMKIKSLNQFSKEDHNTLIRSAVINLRL